LFGFNHIVKARAVRDNSKPRFGRALVRAHKVCAIALGWALSRTLLYSGALLAGGAGRTTDYLLEWIAGLALGASMFFDVSPNAVPGAALGTVLGFYLTRSVLETSGIGIAIVAHFLVIALPSVTLRYMTAGESFNPI
jgi:hypothetical protein